MAGEVDAQGACWQRRAEAARARGGRAARARTRTLGCDVASGSSPRASTSRADSRTTP